MLLLIGYRVALAVLGPQPGHAPGRRRGRVRADLADLARADPAAVSAGEGLRGLQATHPSRPGEALL